MNGESWYPPVHDKKLIRYVEDHDFSNYVIAERMGFAPSTIHKHRVRLGLPTHSRGEKTRPPGRPPEKDTLFKGKPNPVATAQAWLGKALELRGDGFWLYGVPTRLQDVMKETNRLLKSHRAEQVGPEHWRV